MTDIEIPLQNEKTRVYRLFEILPGLISWTVLFLPLLLALINPTYAAYFVVAFMVLWLVKAISMSVRVTQGYNRLSRATQIDWVKKMNELEDVDQSLHKYQNRVESLSREDKIHYNNMCIYASQRDNQHIKIDNIYHLVIVAAYNESIDVIEPTFAAVKKAAYKPENVILALAYEARGGDAIDKTAKELLSKYKDEFGHVAIVKHPADIENEVIGKGGNITFAARRMNKYVEKQGLNPENVIVTTLDSDNRPHPQYLAHLSYMYAINPNRKYVSFQPIPMFLNNIWDVPAPMRILATGNSFWNLIVSMRPHLMRNFAAHAQSMETLIDTDFWSVRTIVEDGHQFWRTYFTYEGRHDVIPLYVPVYQDAVLDETYGRTLKAQFIQLRRWAWGSSDIAYVATKAFFTRNRVPKLDAFFKLLRLFEAHVTWATVPLMLAFAAWIPILLAPEGADSIVAHQLPTIASRLNTFIALGILLTIFLSMRVLPPKPAHYKSRRTVGMYLQWVLMPVVTIGYNALTGLYSQTRLMFGKYLDKFDVTAKVVKKQ